MSSNDLFKSEIETLIDLARQASNIIEPTTVKESQLPDEIEKVCKRIESYFEPNLRNPSDMKISDD